MILKKNWLWLCFYIACLANKIHAGNFLPEFTPTPSLVGGDANIASAPISSLVDLGSIAVINSIVIDNKNRIVAAGFVNAGFNTNFILARFNNDGSLDTTFNAAGPQPGVVVTNAYKPITNDINADIPTTNGNQAINSTVNVRQPIDNIVNFDQQINNVVNTSQRVTGITNDRQGIRDVVNGKQEINKIIIDNNNKIVAVGYVNDGVNDLFTVARYNNDGTLDTTFNSTGVGTNVPGVLITNIENGSAIASDVIIDNNNKIVVTGYADIVTGQLSGDRTNIVLARYNNDGSLDATLNPGEAFSTQPGLTTAVDRMGSFSIRPGVLVTNITGPVQTTILGQNNWAYAITIDNDDRILVAGAGDISVSVNNSSITQSTGSLVIRYNPNGSLDTTFNASGIQSGPPGSAITVVNNTDRVTSVKIDNNNKIVLMGYSIYPTNDDGQGIDPFIIRYNEDASFDTTFNSGALLPPFIQGIITTTIPGRQLVTNSGFIDNNNNMVMGGWSSNQLSNSEVNSENIAEYNFLVIRYLPTGALDPSFNNLTNTNNLAIPGMVITTIPNNSSIVGFLPNARGKSVVLDNNNNIVLGGFSADGPEKDFTIARYTNEGALDVATFNPTGLISNQPGVVIIEADGGTNPYNTKGVAFGVTAMTDVVNLPNVAVDTERAARISSFYIGFKRPVIEAPVDILKGDNSELVLKGSAHPHAIVHLSLNGMPAFSFKASSEGSWHVKFPPLRDGNYHIYATSIDPESHLAFSSNSVNVKVKTQSYIEPSIVSPNTNEYFDTNIVNTRGSGEPNAAVLLFLNKKFVGQAKTNAQGAWEHNLGNLPDGKYFLNVLGFDNLGHLNRKSPAVNFFVDKVPVTPKINNPVNNQIIKEDFVHVSGTAKPSAKMILLLNYKDIGTVLADEKGNWKVKLKDLEQRSYKMQVRAEGVKKISSDIITFKVSKQEKKKVPITSEKPEQKKVNRSPNDMSINGISKPNENIKLLMNGNHIADITPNHLGAWNHQLDLRRIPEGKHKMQYALLDGDKKLKLMVEKPIFVHRQSW